MTFAIVLVFLAVFFGVLALSGLFQPKVDVKKRMNRYIETVTADLSTQSFQMEQHSGSQSEAVKQFRGKMDEYTKNLSSKTFYKQVEFELEKADMLLRGYEFIGIIAGASLGGFFLFFLINQNLVSMIAAAILGFFIPVMVLRMKQQKKLQKFNSQIGDALVLISNSLKAGYGFLQAMEMVSREMPPPIQNEFSRVIQEINLGSTTEDALSRLPERVPSSDLDLVITAMLIQRQIGGNLSEILDNISHTIRERIRIKGEIKTLTAQGRLSGFIIGALPVGIGMFLLLINPKYVMQLFTDPRGQLMVGYAVVAEIIAILIIKKIITIKV